MNYILSILHGTSRVFTRTPPLLFLAIFFATTWFYLFRRIISWDLWWHMAAGRFFWEHGYYPPLDTFTFSPVYETSNISHVWLGDLIFFLINEQFGFTGLQVLRVFAITVVVWLFLYLARYRLNIWTLSGSILLVLGTLQKHLIRNSIFSMFFIAFLVALWIWQARQSLKRKLVALSIILAAFLCWNEMHGSVKVGVGIFACLVLGEFIDQCLDWFKSRRESVVLSRGRVVFLAASVLTLLISSLVVAERWGLNYVETAKGILAIDSVALQESGKSMFDMDRFKSYFRVVFKGGDAGIVAEYQSPFDIPYVISAKAIFVFAVIYLCFFLAALMLHILALFGVDYAKRAVVFLPWSHLIAGLATLHLGLGYLRTIAYPFIVALPLMAYALSRLPLPEFKGSILKFAVFVLHLGMVYPLYWLNENQYSYWSDGQFARFTGFIDTEQGRGKSNKFRDTLPRHVLENHRDEKVYNSYNIGGYLIWEWYLDKQVFIDGRSVIYEAAFYEDYKKRAGYKSIIEKDIRLGLFSLFVDKDRIALLMRNGWYPVVFDNSMVLLRRSKSNEEFFGRVPRFIIPHREVVGMDHVENLGLGIFMRNVLTQLMRAGRFKDAASFIEAENFVIGELAVAHRRDIEHKAKFVKNMVEAFGPVNDAMLGRLCRKLFEGNMKHARYHVAEALVLRGKYTKGLNEVIDHIRKNGESHASLALLSRCFEGLGDNRKALASLNEAIKRKPGYPNYEVRSASLLWKLGKRELAKRKMNTIADADIADPMILFKMARLFENLGDDTRAKRYYQRVLRIDAGYSGARQRLEVLQGP